MWQYNVCGSLWENLQQTSSANLLCFFDLPTLGKSTGRGEMFPKHQHWNSFSGKALGWGVLCKYLGSSASLMSRDRSQCNWMCNVRSLCADSWQLCSCFPLKIENFVPHSQRIPQLLEGPQLSQALCCTCTVCSLRRGQAGSTKDYCKQQNYLPGVSCVFSRGFIATPP